MPSFLYFIPGRHAGLSPKDLAAVGLAYAFDGPISQQDLLPGGGPNGTGGMLLAPGDHCLPNRLSYQPAEQEWVEQAGFWLGRWKGETITPADLLRRKPLDGHAVELADGQSWLCPMARSHLDEGGVARWQHTLPCGVALGEDRKWHPGGPVPRYRRLWQICESWWNVRMASAASLPEGAKTVSFDFDGAYAAACECLAANYRLGPDEASLLGLFDSDSARNILDALIDMPGLIALSQEMEKKTDSRQAGG
jgi:hypothetical protein